MGITETLDRVIGVVSPSWAVERRMARAALANAEKLISYRSSIPTREDPSVFARGTSADWNLELGFDRRKQVDRARQLERDNPIAELLLNLSQHTVVGDGFRLKIKTEDEEWNKRAEDLFFEWANGIDCDERGLLTFNELIAMTWRSYCRDGDVGLVMLENGCIRPIESDEISAPEGGYFRPNMVDGVELDARGRLKTFHVFQPTPGILWSDRRLAPSRLEIPAEQVIFLANRTRFGQTRGLTKFNQLFRPIEQLDGTIEGVMVAHRMAACFGLIVRRSSPWGFGAPQRPDSSGVNRGQIHIEPGAITRVDPGEDIVQVKPEHPGSGFGELTSLLSRMASSGFGFPLEILFYNFSSSNFSNTKAAIGQMHETAKPKQSFMARAATKLKNWKILHFIEEGKLKKRPDALKHVWFPPRIRLVDKKEEIQAGMLEIEGGMNTRTRFLGELGIEFEEIAKELAQEKKILKREGVEVSRSTLSRDPMPPSDEKKRDQDEAGEDPVEE